MPAENLTRLEAIERAATVETSSYHVDLDLTTGPTTFLSTTTLRFTANPGASTFVDLIAPAVHRIVLNGADVDLAAFYDSRIHLDGLAADNELVVEADCAYMTTGEGLHRFVDPVDHEVYLYSQFEVADARRVFACFDQPDLKATFAFQVTAPAHWEVMSVEPAAGEAIARCESKVWTFAETARISTYITAIVAGPYKGSTGELTSSDGRTIPLGVYCRSSLAQYLDAEVVMDITRAGFDYYEREFDRPYPFTKYDQIFVPEFNAGAMENAGCVTYVEAYVFRGQVPGAMRERRVITVLHELAHMWFGNLVTMRWWNDLWLNESFAEYASHMCAAEATELTDAWATFSALEKAWAYNQDQLPTTHPVVAEINDLDDVEVNFDGITYAKGASVLTQLVSWVGREAFIEGLRRYFTKHAFGNTELTDLLGELEAASGRNLTRWSQLWLESAGVNTLSPVIDTADDGGSEVFTRFAVAQTAPDTHPVIRPHRVIVAGYDIAVDGRTLAPTFSVETDVDGELTEIAELAGKRRPDLILINDQDLAYTKVRLDQRSLQTGVQHIGGFASPLTRTVVLAAAWDMTREGQWPAGQYVELALRAIKIESQSTALRVLIGNVRTAVERYTAPEARAQVRTDVGAQLIRLTRAAKAGSDAQLQLSRAAADMAASPDHIAEVRSWYDDPSQLPGMANDDDQRWALLRALAKAGGASREDITAAKDRDATATGAEQAWWAFALLSTPDAKAEVWQAIVETDSLPNQQQRLAAMGFADVRDPSLIAPYAQKYFDALIAVWKVRTGEMAQNLVTGLFPAALAGHGEATGVDVVAMARRWLADNEDAPASLRRLVREGVDTTERAVRAQLVDRASRH